jgi:hypothetical protein
VPGSARTREALQALASAGFCFSSSSFTRCRSKWRKQAGS